MPVVNMWPPGFVPPTTIRTCAKSTLLIFSRLEICPLKQAAHNFPARDRPVLKRIEVYAKKGGSSKRAKKKFERTKPSTSSTNKKGTSPSDISDSDASDSDLSVPQLPSSVPAAIPVDLLQSDGPIVPEGQASDSDAPALKEEIDESVVPSKLPVGDEAKLKLPDLNITASGIRRKRKAAAGTRGVAVGSNSSINKDKLSTTSSTSDVHQKEEQMSLQKVRELTAAYRLGESGRQTLIDELEKEPDFVFQAAAGSKEYDLTSAIFGIGKPNKQGVYILPYLQSAHIVLLAISALVGFVYYPGFPLTEASDDIRSTIKNTLTVVFAVNSVLAVLAFRAASRRAQPKWFWASKTFVLGELAFGELRRNTEVVE